MYENHSIAVVVPAYNEEVLIRRVIETMPEYVDHIVVVDDCSRDGTAEVVCGYGAELGGRLHLIEHETNQGVGGAIATGYVWCRDRGIDAVAVMAGDAQMDPGDLPALLEPVVRGDVDYAKGNRLFTGDAWQQIPKVRYLGNSAMSLLTKIASGYWHVADSQCGYTVINLKALRTINWEQMYRRYGQPNDLLVRLNVHNFRVRDIPVTPVYGIGEDSGVRPLWMIPRLSWLLLRLFLYRMWHKYVIRDFHPLVFFYVCGAFLVFLCLPLSARLFALWGGEGRIPAINALTIVFCAVTGLQLLLFAMWFDMESNRELR